jgi:hypothetical protein
VLNWEEQMRIATQTKDFKKEIEAMKTKNRKEELRKQGVNLNAQKYEQPKYDSLYTLENGSATVLWLIVAIGGLIFNDGWMLSLIATIVWFNYITRHMNLNGGNDNE